MITKLLALDKKVLKRICRPTQEHLAIEWRRSTDTDMRQLTKQPLIYVRCRRIAWVCHVVRAPGIRGIKRIYDGQPVKRSSRLRQR